MMELTELKPESNDLVVVPEGTPVPDNPGFLVYRMKFLHKPSIIKSGYSNMAFLDAFRSTVVAQWLGLGEADIERKSLKDEVFDASNGTKLRDSQLPAEGGGAVPNIQTGYMTNGRLHSFSAADLTGTTVPSDPQYEAKFFRYGRMYESIQKMDGIQRVISPRGGLCVYVELDPAHKTFAFSYALCHNNDNFDKKIARDISIGRFASGDWYEVKDYDASKSILENIQAAIANRLYPTESEPIGAQFSSVSEKVNDYELELIFERIE